MNVYQVHKHNDKNAWLIQASHWAVAVRKVMKDETELKPEQMVTIHVTMLAKNMTKSEYMKKEGK